MTYHSIFFYKSFLIINQVNFINNYKKQLLTKFVGLILQNSCQKKEQLPNSIFSKPKTTQ